ncbi:MAG: hypothetical protein K1X86_00230 [Ignavibacteria bacterium]|nr:hypothetical protein [Ignavibacteria bacterium]
MWNSNTNGGGSNASAPSRKTVRCNNQDYDITGLSGVALVDKLKAIARDNDISKFDIYDSVNTNLDATRIESGNFTGDLTIVRFNVAAA